MRRSAMTEDRRERDPALRRIAGGLWYVAEIALFLPVDLLTVPIRDAVIPRAVKRKLPFLSCRRYVLFSRQVDCGPAMKYKHKVLFKAVVCRHYDADFGECRRPRRQEQG